MSYTFVVISFQYLNSVYSPKSHQVIDFRRFLSRKMERENVKVVKKKKKRREKKNIDEKFISKLESRRKPRCKASFLRFSKEIFIFFSFFFPLFMYIFIYLYNMCNIYIYICMYRFVVSFTIESMSYNQYFAVFSHSRVVRFPSFDLCIYLLLLLFRLIFREINASWRVCAYARSSITRVRAHAQFISM